MKPEAVIQIVDDDPNVHKLLTTVLTAVGFGVECHVSGSDFLKRVDLDQPGCVLLDVMMPRMSGFDLLEVLVAKKTALPVIFITGHGDVATAVRAMKSGAFDFLEKPIRPQDLLERVNHALAENTRARQHVNRRREWSRRLAELTQREREVLRQVVEGRMSKEIACDLGLSLKTVERHRSAIMEKLEVDSLAELVRRVVTQDVPIAV